ncbi:hypothetical protein FKM82_017745 [Ascaphus truei]
MRICVRDACLCPQSPILLPWTSPLNDSSQATPLSWPYVRDIMRMRSTLVETPPCQNCPSRGRNLRNTPLSLAINLRCLCDTVC